MVHYLAIHSAVELNRPEAAFFHYQFEPSGEWWDKAKKLITLNRVIAPTEFMGRPLHHVAHKSDVVRLQALKETGGIYLDLDTISVKPLTELRNCSFAIGQELITGYVPKNARQRLKQQTRNFLGLKTPGKESSAGLCNAVLLSEKNSDFINLWLGEYKSFRSKGRDKYWNEHSVVIPESLAAKNKDSIDVLGPHVFHFPLYNKEGLKSMFEEVNSFPEAFIHHLWESFSWDPYLSGLTREKILKQDTTYNLLARKYLQT